MLTPQENVMSTVNKDDQTYSEFMIGFRSATGYAKVLGINWDSISDKFIFDLSCIVEFAKSLPNAKRSVWRILSKIFDPSGCLIVYCINFKSFYSNRFALIK